MADNIFAHLFYLTAISAILCVIFYVSYAIFQTQVLRMLGIMMIALYSLIWDGMCITDMFSSTKHPIRVTSSIEFSVIIIILFFEYIK